MDLPDLNLALGPMIVDQLNFPQPEPAMPVIAAPLEFYPIFPEMEPPLNVQLDLNQELPPSPAIIESHVNAPLEISQLEDNVFPDEEDGSLFNLNLAEGEDPVIQLASHAEILAAQLREDDQSSFVDEEIEILDCSSVGSSKPDSECRAVTCSSNSHSSAPPGFSIKGKYLSIDDTVADSGSQSVACLSAWEKHFSVRAEGLTKVQVPYDWVDFI